MIKYNISRYRISQKIFREEKPGNTKNFSIIIPTWNNLNYLQLCVNSLRKNSRFSHQLIVHINEGEDGTREWVEQEKLDFTYSKSNVGICAAMNAAFSLAENDYIVYINDDMYACPDWDFFLLQEIEKIGHIFFYLSATMIEPVFSNNACVLAPYNFGRNVEDFREHDLLQQLPLLKKEDWNGASWPPSVMHRNIWEMIGGFSIEFSPGIASDPDLSMKLWQVGVRIFKGVGASKVYHFMSKSTKKAKLNDGRSQFLHKWGVSISTFYKLFLKIGKPYGSHSFEPQMDFHYKLKVWRDNLKRRFS